MLRLRNLLLPLVCAGPQLPSPIHHGGCRLLLSTSTAPFSLEDYLVASCGVAPAKARSASKKALAEASKASARAFDELSSARRHPGFDLDAVLALLAGIGLSRADIADVVAADPILLHSRVDKLGPRLLALRDRAGLSVPQIASFLAVGSRAVRSCRDVCPNIQFVVNFCGSFEQAIVLMKRCNALLKADLDSVIKPNIAFLHQCGLSVRDIAKFGSRNPWMLTFNLERLKEVVQLAEELGVPHSSGMFKHIVAAIACNTTEKHIAKLEFLKSNLGCSRSQVATALSKAPNILGIPDETLLRKIQFLTNEVGLELHYILQRPALLLYSLEKRMVPRHYVIKVLVTKGLLKTNVNFYPIAVMGDKTFSSKFIDSHKDSVPGLADAFAAAFGGRVPPDDQLEHRKML